MSKSNLKLVLKASAGTGKTFRLSLEFVVALLRGVDYKNILVMTFTKKATAEIKKEVLDKIEDFVNIYDLVKKERAQEELTLFSQKDNSISKIIDNSSLEEKQKEKYLTLINIIEKLYKKELAEYDLENLSKIYLDILKNKEKMKIYTIDSFLNIVFKNISTNFLKIKTYSMLDEEDNNFYYKKILENIFKDKKLFSEFKEFFIENSEKDIDNYIKIIKNLIEGRWKYLISLSENQNFYSKEKFVIEKPSYVYLKEIFAYIEDECQKNLEDSLKKDYKKYVGKSDDTVTKLLVNDFKNIFDSEAYNGNKFRKKDDLEHKEYMQAIQEKLRESLAQEIYNDTLIPYEKRLMDLNKEIYRMYDELKIKDRKFTFNDIAIYSYMTIFEPANLLIDENGLSNIFYEALDMQIDTIFIDEFQDTSILQWKILFEIIKKSKNSICVGDEKQSIYGWRGGEKKLFENLEAIIEAENETMDISYRSDKNIVSYTNDIFNKIGEEENWLFKNSNANSQKEGYVKTRFIENSKEEKNPVSIERKLVDELITTNLKNYSDIAIIARTNKELIAVSEILEEEKIPYRLSKEKESKNLAGIFEYLELLKYLIYDRDLSLFNFLASDLSSFGTEELELLLKNKEKTLNYLDSIKDLLFEEKLSEKIIIFLEKIRLIKKEYLNYSAQDFIYKVFEEFNFYKIFNKEINLKNMTELYLLSEKYENSFEFLKAFENNELILSEAIAQESAIELMTIHKSKGLQFKTVFVLNKKEKRKAQSLDFIFSMDNSYSKVKFSLFVKKGYEKVVANCFKEEILALELSQKEEEINNLYVALTRAKNNLIFLSDNDKYFLRDKEANIIEELRGELTFFEAEHTENLEEEKIYSLKSLNLRKDIVEEKIDISEAKFILKNEEKRMLGILIHFFLENIKRAANKEIDYAIKLCYKNYLSYFGEEKLKNIFSKENLEKIFNIAGDIFSEKWNHVYSEYEIYDYENKKSYRIDRIMIKDETASENGEIYIVDYKTGSKNDEQLENYKKILLQNFGEEIKNYNIRTKFLEFNIEY